MHAQRIDYDCPGSIPVPARDPRSMKSLRHMIPIQMPIRVIPYFVILVFASIASLAQRLNDPISSSSSRTITANKHSVRMTIRGL